MSNAHRRFSLPVTWLSAVAVALVLIAVIPVVDLGRGLGARWIPSAKEWGASLLALAAVGVLLVDYFPDYVDRAVERVTALVMRPTSRAFALGVAAAVTLVCAGLSWYCFANQSFTGDEMSMRFEARLLASGRLWAQPEAHREFFNTPEALDASGRWFSHFPVGWPLLLAPAMLVGLEWLVAPLCAGAATLAFYRFTRRVGDDLSARFTTLLFALSPWMLFLGASQENHAVVLAFTTIALAAVAGWAMLDGARDLWRRAAVIGFSIGAIGAIRPYDAVLVGAAIGTFQVVTARRTGARWLSFVPQVLAGAIPLAVVFYVNARTTGDPLLFAYDALNGTAHRPGFHETPRGVVHTPAIGLLHASGYFLRLNTALFEWPIPAMLVVAAGMFATRTPSRWDHLLLGLMGAVVLGYVAYWSESYFARAPRFYLAALPAFVWFAARFPSAIASHTDSEKIRRFVILVIPLCTLAAWRPMVRPWTQSGMVARATGLHRDSPVLKVDVDALVAGRRRPALVFVNESWRARLLGGLRVLGLEPGQAVRIVDERDACALQAAIDAERASPVPGDALERVSRRVDPTGEATPIAGHIASASISLSARAEHPVSCYREFQRDSLGIMPFAMFLAHQRFDSAGRLAGPVVFAIDHGEHNEVLRQRFGDREWLRLVLRLQGTGVVASLEPYTAPAVTR